MVDFGLEVSKRIISMKYGMVAPKTKLGLLNEAANIWGASLGLRF